MQKVAKELLPKARSYQGDMVSEAVTISSGDISSITALINHRQAKLLGELAGKMANATDIYDAWMHRLSPLIQATARAFGERICWTQLVEALSKCTFSKYAFHCQLQGL